MEQKITGVYGRLGDLATIKTHIGNYEKYDEIITSCLGNKLDNIVVKDI